MSKDDAIKVISEVCAQFKGTLADHNAIQNALKIMVEVVKKSKEEENAKELNEA